jgi:hypothetical protein
MRFALEMRAIRYSLNYALWRVLRVGLPSRQCSSPSTRSGDLAGTSIPRIGIRSLAGDHQEASRCLAPANGRRR